jgi:hypothetical protein
VVICDFCGEPGLRAWWRFPCASFEAPGAAWVSRGDWLACERCCPYVESEDYVGLLQRVLTASVRRGDLTTDPFTAWVWVRRLWPMFAANRRGPRRYETELAEWRN